MGNNKEISFKEMLSYIAGFFDGEGSLKMIIEHYKDWSKATGYCHIRPAIYLFNKDTELLDEVAEILADIMSYSVSWEEHHKKNADSVWSLKLMTFEDIVDFAQCILPYSKGKKKKQLGLLLEEYVPIVESRPQHPYNPNYKTWTKELFLKAVEVADKINSLKGGKRGKYNAEYFRRLWNESRR